MANSASSPLASLGKAGQSVWLDYIRRRLLTSGELRQLVGEGLSGVTSNPSIFQSAIGTTADYDEAIRSLLKRDPRKDVVSLYEALVIDDIRSAADVLRPVHQATKGTDGYVSLEVSPHLAHDTPGTIADARRLWQAVDRPNLMVKVPATREGFPAIEALIAGGINVNVTLLFSLRQYEEVALAYIRGLEQRKEPGAVASVASFFVSRIDTLVDRRLEAVGSPQALSLRGKVAVAVAKRVYQRFREIFYGDAFKALRQRGGRVQRPLWGSTSTKNPAYSDVLYVEELIGPDTVNTVPPATLDAFRDHGRVRSSLKEGWDEAASVLKGLEQAGVDLDAAGEQLQVEGVAAFAASYDQLLETLEAKRRLVAVR